MPWARPRRRGPQQDRIKSSGSVRQPNTDWGLPTCARPVRARTAPAAKGTFSRISARSTTSSGTSYAQVGPRENADLRRRGLTKLRPPHPAAIFCDCVRYGVNVKTRKGKLSDADRKTKEALRDHELRPANICLAKTPLNPGV